MSVRYNAEQLAYARRNPPKNYEYLVSVNRGFQDIYDGIAGNVTRMAVAAHEAKKKRK